MDNNLPVNAGDMRSIPGPGKIPQATDQLSPCAQLLSRSAATEAHAPGACALQQEKTTAMQYLCTARQRGAAACSQRKPERGSEDPVQPKID